MSSNSETTLHTRSSIGAPGSLWRSVALPLLLLAVAFILIGSIAYGVAREAVTKSTAMEMRSIARLKQVQIEQWLDERRDELRLIITSQLALGLKQWLDGGMHDEVLRAGLNNHLIYLANSRNRALDLHSATDGHQLLGTTPYQDLPQVHALTLEAAKHCEMTLEDVHVAEGKSSSGFELGLFGPVCDAGDENRHKSLAIIHLSFDPGERLFPLLQMWPGSSPSAETQVVRVEGEEVVFLNPLRHAAQPPLALRLPRSSENLIAAQLLREGEGFFEANDYRGMPSFAHGLPIPGTPWYLVAKIDRSEVFHVLDEAAVLCTVLLGVLWMVCAWWLIERRRTHESLQTALTEAEDLYQNAPCGYHSLDRNGVITQINDTELKLLGYEREEIVGKKKLHELLTLASQLGLHEVCSSFMSEGVVTEKELEFLRKDGEVIPVHVTATAVRNETGRYLMSRAVVTDITERKRAENKKQRLDRAWRLWNECHTETIRADEEAALLQTVCRHIVETGNYPMAWIGLPEDDADKSIRVTCSFGDKHDDLSSARLTWADNELGCGLAGTAIREGRTQVAHDLGTHPAMAPWKEAIRAQRAYHSAIALPLKSAERVLGVLMIYSMNTASFAGEEILLLENISVDLASGIQSLRLRAAQESAQIALREHQDLLHHVLEALPIGVFIANQDGVIVHGNPAGKRIWAGIRYVGPNQFGEYEGWRVADGKPFASQQWALARAITKGEKTLDEVITVEGFNGITKTVLNSALPLCDAAGSIIGAIVVMQDISENRRIDKELRDSREKLRKMAHHEVTVREMERKRIARELHDELGQMLTGLKMELSSLLRTSPPTESLTTNLLEMNRLIDEVLRSVRRISADLRPIMLDELGLKAALEWMSEEFEKRHGEISCMLWLDFEDDRLNPEISITTYRIIQECLTNVARHSSADQVGISIVCSNDDWVLIRVQDNGTGMSAEEQEGRFGLTGMGERARALGGIFTLYSPPGEGVLVEVRIPLNSTSTGGGPAQ